MKYLTVCILLISCGQPFSQDFFSNELDSGITHEKEIDANYDVTTFRESGISDSNIRDIVTSPETTIDVKCCGNSSIELPCNIENEECSFVYDVQTYLCVNHKWTRTENYWRC